LRNKLCILAICLAVTASSAAWASYPMRVKDVRGKDILIKARPMRIVSVAPSNTEILYALGLGDRVVGVTRYCDYPATAKSKPKIGDMTVNAEAVVALKPDLVLAHGFVNSSAIPRLEKLGLTVFALDPKTLGEVARDIRTVGKITARPKTASHIARSIEAAVKEVKLARARKPSRKVLVVIQSNPLWDAGPKTFVDEMLTIANAKNTAFDARPGFVPFSRELAISRNPDVIVTGQKSDIDFFTKSPEWRNVSAIRNKRIYVIDSDFLLRASPRLAEGLKTLAAKIGY
jgi:iron complex transport system substrate-binding protein